jgi:hypothetical protein
MMFKPGDIVEVVETHPGYILKCFGKPGTPLTVSKCEGKWVSILGYPQEGSYTYVTQNFKLMDICLENK